MPAPLANFASAADAYAKAHKGAGMPHIPPPGEISQAEGGDFADMVHGALKQAERIGKRSEMLTVAGVTDRADLHEVVSAVAEAEVTLQTVVAVRDKVVEAYKEILRMPM
ncbi:MAG: flagellar hook-basal body complex protein FliE [Rhodospirillales bacterium]